MDVLKLATAGSVDDGKSTLIGRLLYDTQSLTEDKLNAIEERSRKKGYDYLDFSLATDGLLAEREQGITIDVAHIYFATKNRSYVIADAPGHIEYTRNMVTGASNAQASIILIDARKGVLEQTYRHLFINHLLRVKQLVVAVNKMDLVDYSYSVFEEIKSAFLNLINQSEINEEQVTFIPISALKGDNVVENSSNMDWYSGPSILTHLESLNAQAEKQVFRFPVQNVIRPKQDEFHDFRGYAGKVYGQEVKVGDQVTILPSKKETVITGIHSFNESYTQANPGSAVTLTFSDDINVTRGDTIVKSSEVPSEQKLCKATICWMDTKPLQANLKYTIQHNTNKVLSKIKSVNKVINPDFSGEESQSELQLNQIGEVDILFSKPIYVDRYTDHKQNGSFIVIDPISNTTAGVGFIR